MRKNFLVGIICVGLVLAVAFGVHLARLSGDSSSISEMSASTSGKVLDVDEIVRHPNRFDGPIGVTGKVVKVDEPETLFALGCEDACVVMPVRYRGRMPELGSNIVAYGEIKEEEEGKYIFEAEDIEAR